MHPEKDTAEAFLLRRAAKTGVPITGSFELTPLCNLNCKMCYVRMNRTEQEKISRLQTAEEWTALAEKLRDAGMLFLLLTGRRAAFVPRVSRGVSRGAKARYDRYGEHERHAFE